MKAVVMLLMLFAPSMVQSARNKKEEPEEEVTFMALMDEEEDVTSIQAEGADMWELGEDSATVAAANEEYEDSGITNLMEIRTKLKFIGNQVELRNPQMMPTLVEDIAGQMATHAESKFLLCLHVGTTAAAEIKSSRPGFIEGRSETLLSALHEHDADLGVGESTILDGDVFEHFGSTRFAGLVMKVYTGDTDPGCKQEDLVPPSA